MQVNALCLKGFTKKNIVYYDSLCKISRRYEKAIEKCEKLVDECEVIALTAYGFSEQQAKKVVKQARKVK